MNCRIGMAKAANVKERIDHWMTVEEHTDFSILHRKKTYDQATALEEEEASERGCWHKRGGPRDSAQDWCVYHVWGGKIVVAAKLLSVARGL